MEENRSELKSAQQKLEALEQKLEALEQKLEDLKQRKLALELKQVEEGLSATENVLLKNLVEEIADLKKDKEDLKKDKEDLKKDKEDLKKDKTKWMDIIEIAIKKGSKQKEEKYYEFTGKVVGSKAVKGIRKTLYRFAQTHSGYYHPHNKAFEYEDGTLLVDIVFQTKTDAHNFQTEFEFISTNIAYSQLETESDVNPIDLVPLSGRILLKDYKSIDYDSPEDSMFSKSEFTEYQPTDDVVVYQSLEKMSWLEDGSEGAHLMAHHICKKRKRSDSDKSENNRLALSRQLHGYVDGLSNGFRPTVKLNYVPSSEEFVDSRYRVVVGVEFLNERVKGLVVPLLKDSSREQAANPLVYEVDVFVRNKEEFIECLEFKSKETQKLWEELEFR